MIARYLFSPMTCKEHLLHTAEMNSTCTSININLETVNFIWNFQLMWKEVAKSCRLIHSSFSLINASKLFYNHHTRKILWGLPYKLSRTHPLTELSIIIIMWQNLATENISSSVSIISNNNNSTLKRSI